MPLPTNIAGSYPDRGPGDTAHQEHHDAIHAAVNEVTEGRLTEAALSAAIGRGKGTSLAVGAFVRKLATAVDPVSVITAVGDSTGVTSDGWLTELVRDEIGTEFPSHTIQQRQWEHENQRYALVPTVYQTGTDGPRRFVSTGSPTDRYFAIEDSPAVSPTGDLDVRFRLNVAQGGAITVGGKYNTAISNGRSWFVSLDSSSRLNLYWSTDGTSATQVVRPSSPLPAGAFGTPTWYRVTLDADNGAGGHTVTFYYSQDGQTWTEVSQSTNAGTVTMFDSAIDTQINGRGGTANSTGGVVEYYAFQMFTSLAAGAAPVVDFEAAQWHGYGTNGSTASFTDYVGNVVYMKGTGNGGAMQGAPVLTLVNGCTSGAAISYANDVTRFPKLTPTPSDLAIINFGHNEVSEVFYRDAYKQLTDAILAKWPDAGVLAVAQNPRIEPAENITEHTIRVGQIRQLAASQDFALLDAYKVIDEAGPVAYLNADGIHPTSAGYDLLRDAAWDLFDTWL